VEKASTHPEKVQTNISKYLHPLAHGFSVKSTIMFSKGVPPTLCIWGGAPGLVGGCFWHTNYTSHMLSYAGELGNIKMLDQVISRAVCPE
jgi:hypothetical protein